MTRRCRDIKYLLREVDSLWLWPNLIAVGFCVSLPCCPLGPSRICAPCSLVLPESVVGLGALIHEDLLGPLWYCSPAVVGCSVKNDKGFASVEKVPGSRTAGEEHKVTCCKTLVTWDTGLEFRQVYLTSFCLPSSRNVPAIGETSSFSPHFRSWIRPPLSERQASLFRFSISRHTGEAIRAAPTQENVEPRPYLSLWVPLAPMSVRKPWPCLSLRDRPCSEWSLQWFSFLTALRWWSFPAKTNNYISMVIKSYHSSFCFKMGLHVKWKKFLMTCRHRTKVDKKAIPRMTLVTT